MRLETDKECIERLMESSKKIICERCGTELQIGQFPFCGGDPAKHVSAASVVIGDDFPGGVWIRHGAVNDDGSPRKFYSKTEIKRVLNEKGLVWVGDTPGKSYKVPWSGKRQDIKEQVLPRGEARK